MSLKTGTQILSLHLRQLYKVRHLCTITQTPKPKEKWDLYAGLLLERLPVITKELHPIEKQVQVLLFDKWSSKTILS